MSKNKKTAKEALKGNKKKGKKHVFVLIDESGSMNGLQESVIDGCNEFISAFAKDKHAKMSIGFFDKSGVDDIVRMKYNNINADGNAVRQLVAGDYHPRGMTPLNDAIAYSLEKLKKNVEGDEAVFLAIITDGLENASELSTSNTKILLKDVEKKGWSVVYVGANVDVNKIGKDYGLGKTGQTFAFRNTPGSVGQTMGAVTQMAVNRSDAGGGVQGQAVYDSAAKKLHEETGGKFDGKKPKKKD